VQNEHFEEMEKRLKYYSDRLSSTTLKKGDDYRETQKVILIAILNHKFYKEEEQKYEHEFKILNTENQLIYDDSPLEIIIFDKMKKEYFNANDPLDRLLMYLYGFFNAEELKHQCSKDELLKNIEKVKNMISKSQEAEIAKIGQEIREMDEKIRMEIATKKATKKGRIEGKKEEKIELALKLRKKNFSLEDISDVTDLSIEKIENLQS
jgi:predicted transposase/invertase (TIGR01784 family)